MTIIPPHHRPPIEHEGITYACYDAVRRDNELAERVYDWQPQRVVNSVTTLENVRWRSDQGWVEPHDVEICGEYIIINRL